MSKNTKSSKKTRKRLCVVVSHEVENRLRHLSAHHGVAISRVAESLIEAGLGDNGETDGTNMQQRLDSLEGQTKLIESQIRELRDVFSGYLLQYFCLAPQLPDNEAKAAWERGKARYKRFLQRLEDQLALIEKDAAA